MKFITTIFVITLLAGCSSSTEKADVVEPQIEYTQEDIQGEWTYVKTEVIVDKQSISTFKEATEFEFEQGHPVYWENDTLKAYTGYLAKRWNEMIITNDVLVMLNYPLERVDSRLIRVEQNKVKIGGDREGRLLDISPDKNTMTISYSDSYGMYLEETYTKSNLDDSIVNILMEYEANFPLLAGKWELLREFDVGGGEIHTLYFPFDVPDVIELTKEQLIETLYKDRSCYVLTNGVMRKYFLNYGGGCLDLVPDKWYNREKYSDPEIELYAASSLTFIRIEDDKAE